ncbi:Uncharacterised protein [uncultured archaeon]|nr:Uncharacterised protein [uncultured archaeon]
MAKTIQKIGTHTIEADYSAWTGMAKIRLDGQELLSKFTFGHTEIITVDDKKYAVKFYGIIFPNVEIQEI